MARQRIALQVNQFVGGFNTEANPLNFPPNASVDEENMELQPNGSRKRRNGFDVEEDYVEVDTGQELQSDITLHRNQVRWDNPGGDADAQLVVVRIGSFLAMHDPDVLPLSDSLVYSENLGIAYDAHVDMTVVDGKLIVADGNPSGINVYDYDGTTVTKTQSNLLIRDFFGVESPYTGASELTTRPSDLPNTHLYNLRNQTFALPRVTVTADTTALVDPINAFKLAITGTKYPSMADSIIPHLYANTGFTDKTVERFHADSLIKNPPGTNEAPRGYFIINALARGPSRIAGGEKLDDEYSFTDPFDFTTGDALPVDTTTTGATAVATYGGRAWFAGFGSEVTDGDALSPDLSSYLLFSQVVRSTDDIFKCYQQADPTSPEDPDLADSDGGYIKIDGAYGIKALVHLDSSLFVIAENGVWRVSGLDENSFVATGFTVSKITKDGCISGSSVIVNKSALAFWGYDAIYGIQRTQTGEWESVNLTRDTIQTFYDEIPVREKVVSVGHYNEDTDTARWLYGGDPDVREYAKELLLDFRYSAFTKNKITSVTGVVGPITIGDSQPRSNDTNLLVTASGEAVVDEEGENVTVPLLETNRDDFEIVYCILVSVSPTLTYTFGTYNSTNTPSDWVRIDDVGVDTPAYLTAASVTGSDARLRKDVPYLTVYFERTEAASQDSSCILNTRWDWTTASTAKRWSSPREIYRPSRTDAGDAIVVTRSLIRGGGRSVSFHFASSEGKTMHINGWDFNLEAGKNE
jgi:hypothetical protein